MSNDIGLIIDKTHFSPNYNQRIFYLIIHYTALHLEDSLKVLTDPKKQCSAHYLVPASPVDEQRKIFQLVPEENRSWHSGISAWGKRIGLNDTSIGIEVVNLGYKEEKGQRIWYPFSEYQIDSVIALAKTIIKRYQISPTCVIGHADVALGRKVDPGPLFPWKKLHEQGVGAWFDEQTLEIKSDDEIDIATLQKNLKTYGYAVQLTERLDDQTRAVLKAFQMHFRPSDYSGNPDAETVAILENLVKKYFSH